jgi:hypothetical protein
MRLIKSRVFIAFALAIGAARSSVAAPFTVSYLDGGTWNTVFAQGFSTSLGATPNPGVGAGSTVFLNSFEFFKSGNADTASNIRLAILNNIFADLTGLSTGHSAFVALSANEVAGTAPIATGDPILFNFGALPLTYGNNYAAVFVNLGAGGQLTPVQVSALTANYSEQPPGSGSFHPTTNYGTENQFEYATSNFITTNQFGMFFNTFSFAGDANFRATLNTVPEPSAVVIVLGAVTSVAAARRRLTRMLG